jgi:hypothetical protein
MKILDIAVLAALLGACAGEPVEAERQERPASLGAELKTPVAPSPDEILPTQEVGDPSNSAVVNVGAGSGGMVRVAPRPYTGVARSERLPAPGGAR